MLTLNNSWHQLPWYIQKYWVILGKKEYISQNPFHSPCRVYGASLVKRKLFTMKVKSLWSVSALNFLSTWVILGSGLGI